MKKLSYYLAAFCVCCAASQTLTSCVDETEDPDYVKQIRQSELEKEVAENKKDANAAAQEANASFTTAYLEGTLSDNTTAYAYYMQAKTAYEFATKQFEIASNNLTIFYESIHDKAMKIYQYENELNSYNDNPLAESASDYEKAKRAADVLLAQNNLDAYKNGVFPLYKESSSSFINGTLSLPYALESDPESWKLTYGNYLACQQATKDAKAKYDEYKIIYDEAINAQKAANN